MALVIDLGGAGRAGGWRAIAATDDLRRRGVEVDADDGEHAGWVPIDVPGHWQRSGAFADHDGPLLYRQRFETPPPAAGRRRWLTMEGIFYQADAWLDGAYLGDPEGYFVPHSFDITALSRLGTEHVVAVEVACAKEDPVAGRRNITGAYQRGVGVPPTWNPGGLWGPVQIVDTGPVRISRLRVLCRDADHKRAHLRILARLDSDDHRRVELTTSIDGVDRRRQEHPLAAGENEVEWSVDIPNPRLWWPHALGAQELTDVAVTVSVSGEASDCCHRRTGLRQIAWDDWVCSVNGERLFLKGAVALPSRPWPADAEPGLARDDVAEAVALGLDAIRVHQHLAPHELYDAADEAGLLVLQDFPLRGAHARSVRRQAVAQARDAVDAYGHHPSIALWTAHDDPIAADLEPGQGGWRTALRRIARQQLPTWNKSVLDRWVKRSFETADVTRRTVPHSGLPAHLPQLDGTDAHLWFGWRTGEASDLVGFASRLPRRVRFVSEFGAHSVPDSLPPPSGTWPDLDWDSFEERYGYERRTFEQLFPADDFSGFAEWRSTTLHYQSHVLKVQIETLRRLKYRPTGGFCFAHLADPAPAVTGAVLDHERRPKPAHAVVRAACAPLIVVADQPPDWVNAGDELRFDVHVVSDRRDDIDDATVEAVVTWAGGSSRRRFGGPIGADSVVKAGAVRFEVPDSLGELTIELAVFVPGANAPIATNHYTTAITVPTV